ncbi:MAG TPA: hypothetical protein VIL01_06615 [Thermomicrobiales bacterium]
MSAYRIEHRVGGQTTVVGHTTDVHARQEELSRIAMKLVAAGATGELVLIDEETGEEVARRYLRDDPDAPAQRMSRDEAGDAGRTPAD